MTILSFQFRFSANVSRRRRVPCVGLFPKLLCVRDAAAHIHGPDPPPNGCGSDPSNPIKDLLPPELPGPVGVAELQGVVPPLGPAPLRIEAANDVSRTWAHADGIAWAALGAAEWAAALEGSDGDAEAGGGEGVAAVAEDAEGDAEQVKGDAVGGELGLEGGLRIQAAKASGVKGGDEGEAGECDAGGAEITDTKAVVEAAIGGAWGDEIAARDEGGGGERGEPIAVDSGSDDPVVGEVVLGLVGGYHGQAPLH